MALCKIAAPRHTTIMHIKPEYLLGAGLVIVSDNVSKSRKVKKLEERVRELESPASRTTSNLPSGDPFGMTADYAFAVIFLFVFPPLGVIMLLFVTAIYVGLWFETLKQGKMAACASAAEAASGCGLTPYKQELNAWHQKQIHMQQLSQLLEQRIEQQLNAVAHPKQPMSQPRIAAPATVTQEENIHWKLARKVGMENANEILDAVYTKTKRHEQLAIIHYMRITGAGIVEAQDMIVRLKTEYQQTGMQIGIA